MIRFANAKKGRPRKLDVVRSPSGKSRGEPIDAARREINLSLLGQISGRGVPACYLYVITAELWGPLKIGYSVDVAARLSTLQTSHWERLMVVTAFRCRHTDAASAIERAVHARLKDSRLNGEWFRATIGEACAAIELCADRLGIPIENILDAR